MPGLMTFAQMMLAFMTLARMMLAFMTLARMISACLSVMTALPFPLLPVVFRMLSMTLRPWPLQIVERLLIRIIPIGQFPLIQVIRRIRVAKFGVFQHILFRLIVRVCDRVLALFIFVRCHNIIFSSRTKAGPESQVHYLCHPGTAFAACKRQSLVWH
jgi:hypothetical protein